MGCNRRRTFAPTGPIDWPNPRTICRRAHPGHRTAPTTGLLYLSSAAGIESFDPETSLFRHFSDERVGSLAFHADGVLWGATWPNRGDIVKFDNRGRAQLMLRLGTPVDSLTFGAKG